MHHLCVWKCQRFTLCKNLQIWTFDLIHIDSSYGSVWVCHIHQEVKRSAGSSRSWPKAESPVPNVGVWAGRRWRGWRNTWGTADWWVFIFFVIIIFWTLQSMNTNLWIDLQELFTCQHCGKQLKSSTGMKYHVMADHSHLVNTVTTLRRQVFPLESLL